MSRLNDFAMQANMYVCLICKAPSLVSVCSLCLGGLVRHRESTLRERDRLPVYSMLAWRDSGPRAVPWLVRSLKGCAQAEDWSSVALLMLQTFGLRKFRGIVPIPSPHSLGLARALSHWTGAPILEVLHSGSPSGSQKRRSRRARQAVTFTIDPLAYGGSYANVIICDDVVTTGATIRAAYRALGEPRDTQAWCLADRLPCAG